MGKKQNIQEGTQLVVPQLLVPFSLVDPEKASLTVIPRQVDDGIYRLRSSTEIQIDINQTILFRTGIKLNIPKYIDMSECKGIPVGTNTSVFPRVSVVAQINSIFDLMVNHGLEVIGPHVLTANVANGREVVVYIKNIGKKLFVIKPGDEIAELSFTLSPLTILRLNQNSENNHD